MPVTRLICLLFALLLALPASAAEDFLEPEKAFRISARVADERTVEVAFDIEPGYYMYREQFRFAADGAARIGTAAMPSGKVKYDETFQKDVETYRNRVAIAVPVLAANGPFRLTVTSQGCADKGLCYPPMPSVVEVRLAAFGGASDVRVVSSGGMTGAALSASDSSPAGSLAINTPSLTDSARIDAALQSGRFWIVVGVFFIAGLLLSFTPCVLPMLPILSSIIAGTDESISRRRGLALASSYSLGMALVYTVFGVAAGLVGEGLAAALQTPWVLFAFAAVLAGFALSMFDVYELRLPSGLANGLTAKSQQLPGGQVAAVFAMGGLSALIVSPCVTAPLAGALVFLSQTRDVVLGGSALFALAAGMSVPLLVLGASAGSWLPRSGSWMHAVKRFFGLLLLGVAIWVAQPVLPVWAVLGVWGLLLLVAGFMLRPFDPSPHSASPRVWLQRALGVMALTLGVIQVVGAASGGRDPLRPLAHLVDAAAAEAPRFRLVRDVVELDSALRSAGRPVMLDFYADWCVSCKEMERYTFSDATVAAMMSRAVLLKADVTANSEADRALLKRFRLFGPPGTIFFDAQGREIEGVRVIGFQNAERFALTLRAVGL